jgi:hypothetical protein
MLAFANESHAISKSMQLIAGRTGKSITTKNSVREYFGRVDTDVILH